MSGHRHMPGHDAYASYTRSGPEAHPTRIRVETLYCTAIKKNGHPCGQRLQDVEFPPRQYLQIKCPSCDAIVVVKPFGADYEDF